MTKEILKKALWRGRRFALTAKKITAVTGLRDREIQILADELRRDNVPVLAACDKRPFGYFIAETADEIDAYISNITARRDSLSVSINTARKLKAAFQAKDNGPLFEEGDEIPPINIGDTISVPD